MNSWKKALLLLFLLLMLFTVTYVIPTTKSALVPLNDKPDRGDSCFRRNPNTYLVFVNGLRSSFEGDLFESIGYGKLRQALKTIGFTYYDGHFLLYSYKGGRIINGVWQPNVYSVYDTGQPLTVSVSLLGEMLEQISRANPEAKFILLGHSLGGRIAFDYAAQLDSAKLARIKALVTLDAPLLGAGLAIPTAVVDWFTSNGSVWGTPAVREVVAETVSFKKNTAARRAAIRKFQSCQVTVATFASYQDALVGPFTSCILDEAGRALTQGGILDIPTFSSNDPINHLQIMDQPAVIKYLIKICTM